jgi:signal transduction histidine kinase
MTRGGVAFTVQSVGTRLPRLRVVRPDPLKLDCALAVVLVLAAELQIWIGGADGFQVAAASIAPPLAATVAIRRVYPALAGFVAQGTIALTFAVWGDTQILGSSIAWFCSLYALTVWTTSPRFVAGAGFVFASNLAAAVGPVASIHRSAPFALVTLVVMLLIRRVLGDRERRVQLAERERDVAAREAVVEERARIARELHDAVASSRRERSGASSKVRRVRCS